PTDSICSTTLCRFLYRQESESTLIGYWYVIFTVRTTMPSICVQFLFYSRFCQSFRNRIFRLPSRSLPCSSPCLWRSQRVSPVHLSGGRKCRQCDRPSISCAYCNSYGTKLHRLVRDISHCRSLHPHRCRQLV